jgi:hypothetical protein
MLKLPEGLLKHEKNSLEFFEGAFGRAAIGMKGLL